jgi:outer membrane protein OmpA-like peptidoglycan-associated protein
MRAAAVLAAGALAAAAAGCSSSTGGTFSPAAAGTRPLPSIAPDQLPTLGKFVRETDGSQVSTLSADYLFDEGSSTLLPEATTALQKLVPTLQNYPGKIQIVGYTDGVGSADLNLALSNKRADAVVSVLVADGIDQSVLQAVGKGEQGAQPGVADSSRRMVEIVLK